MGASCEWYAHVLEKYTDLELRAVVEVALGHRLCGDSAVLDTAKGGYKEVQVHGELAFADHIEVVVLHPSRVGTPVEKKVRAWCEKYKLGLEFMPTSQSCETSLWRWGASIPDGPRLHFDAFSSGV